MDVSLGPQSIEGANLTSKESAYRFLPFGKRSLSANAFVERTSQSGVRLSGGHGQVPRCGSLSRKVGYGGDGLSAALQVRLYKGNPEIILRGAEQINPK